MVFDYLAGKGRSRIILGLSHALMEPGVVGAGVGRFILATYFLKSAPISFVGLVHQPLLRKNAVRDRCNNYSGLRFPSRSIGTAQMVLVKSAKNHAGIIGVDLTLAVWDPTVPWRSHGSMARARHRRPDE